ncbi:MAG TPA: amylo-alpha-1,6-glucosidase [Sedimentisphaerales bacterium]|nr:amylo-alpha-1,6-glucosidase [Sedimentisphaerales bacterium]
MVTLQKADNRWPLFCNRSQKGNPAAISISIANQPIENLLTREWLLTNERGSYASSTIAGCNTRGYHGLLIGSLNPPVNRIMTLNNCLEMVIVKGQAFNLSTFEFSDKFAPTGFTFLRQFRRDIGAHFDYELAPASSSRKAGSRAGAVIPAKAGIKLTKSVYLLRDTDTVALVYDFTSVQEPVEFVLRPFVGLRDFHTLQNSHAPLYSRCLGDGVLVRHDIANSCKLFLSCQSVRPVRNFTESKTTHKSKISFKTRGNSPSANPATTPVLSNGVHFENDRQWWFNFVYRNNRERGQDFTEDLWTPGFFKCRIDPGTPCGETPAKIVLWAHLSPPWVRCKPEELTNLDIDTVREDLVRHQESIKLKAKSVPLFASGKRQGDDLLLPAAVLLRKRNNNGGQLKNRYVRFLQANRKVKIESRKYFEALCLTAEAFIAKRQTDHTQRTTILAGYPWFADWGRDAFISLPGLLLSTGRFDEAKSVLTTFAAAADEGMIPNCFDDRNGTTYFNSVDASLWFINAAFQYLKASGGLSDELSRSHSKTFMQDLMPAIRWIIDAYNKGTRFDIHADADGLITAGDNQTQLTWMDAKYESIAFTPRCGKAVEVNALWYNSLCLLARFYIDRDAENAKHYKSMADKVQKSFCELFWNESKGHLNDCILPDGLVDESLRPNQIFAVSLPFSALSPSQQKSVVNVVQKQLLTPYGLRTLNVQDSRYKGVYTGPQQQRDEAYHQGTVWAFLLGPFVESYLKVNGFSRKSRKKAAKFIQPLLEHMTKDGCLGSVSEIFDGDAPHKPRGCIAQAWSVAELIRVYQLINS